MLTGSSLMQALPIAVVVGLCLAMRPVAIPVAAVLLCQEFTSSGTTSPGQPSSDGGISLSLGRELYFGLSGGDPNATTSNQSSTVLPILGLFALAAVCVAVQLRNTVRFGAMGKAAAVTLATIFALIVCAASYGVMATGELPQAINQEARPFLLMLLAFVVGFSIKLSPRSAASTNRVAGVVLCGLALLAIFEMLTGSASLNLSTSYPAFYDAALPAAAGAILLAIVFQREARLDRGQQIVALAALVIVVVSLRRNVWVAVAVAAVIALAVAYGRGRAARRIATGIGLIVVAALAIPGVAAQAGTRLYETLYSLNSNADESAKGHVSDLTVGWAYATQSPVTGIGSRHPPLPGLVVQGPGVVYVHNEWLLDWLRFGLAGLVLITLLFLLLIGQAVAVLRARASSTLAERASAMFVLMVPVSCITAPFLSQTSRWPAMFGLAAGVLASRHAARALGLVTDPATERFLPGQQPAARSTTPSAAAASPRNASIASR
jgi:O-antigen ligase